MNPPGPPTRTHAFGRLQLGFRTRLFGVSLLLMVACAVASLVWLEVSLRPLMERQAITELQGSAALVHASVHPRLGLSPAALTDTVHNLASQSDLRITLIDPDGAVHADSSIAVDDLPQLDWHGDRPEVVGAHDAGMSGVSRRHSDTLDEDMVYVAIPIEWSTGRTGTLRVARTITRADAPIFALYRLLGFAVAGGFILALLMTQLAATSMDRDLGILLRHTTALARGETAAPISMRSSVALAGIAGTVAQMAQEAQRVVRALAEERRRSVIVLGAVREGLLSVDRDWRLTLVNPACRRLLGIGTADLGRRLDKALDCPELVALIERARVEGEVMGDLSVDPDPLVDPTVDRVLQARVTPGEEAGHVISLVDITHLRRLETIRRDFVANVSHELRTPISIVQASAEALQDGAIDDPRYSAQFLDAILRNSDRLVLLTKDILQLSRIEAGQSMLDLEPVVVSEVVIDVIEIFHQRSRARKQRVVSTVDPMVAVVADAGALEQVLVNLLDNAMKYTPKKGTIRVSTAPGQDDRVRILVADGGPGIPEKHRPRLFERFYRVDSGRSREEGGTGLGLAIVKHLAESMDGAVGVEPNQPQGSIFWLELPEAPIFDAHEPTTDGLPPVVDSPAEDGTG